MGASTAVNLLHRSVFCLAAAGASSRCAGGRRLAVRRDLAVRRSDELRSGQFQRFSGRRRFRRPARSTTRRHRRGARSARSAWLPARWLPAHPV